MAVTNDSGIKAFVATSAITRYRRVKLTTSSGTAVEHAGLGEDFIGYALDSADADDPVAVKLRSAPGAVKAVASEAFAAGASLYGAAAGKVADTSSGSVVGVALEAATADGDIVEICPEGLKGTTAGTVSVLDAGGFTAQTTVEAALAELYQNLFTVQAFIPVTLMQLREATNFDVGAITANGGVLASDTTPVLEGINDATDGCQRVVWASSNNDQVIFQTPLPPNLDAAANLVLHVRARMGGATNTPTIAVDSFFDEGDTKVQDVTGAITGTTWTEYTATIAAADFPASQTLTIGLTPGAHTTDTLEISAIWLEYKQTLLTS